MTEKPDVSYAPSGAFKLALDVKHPLHHEAADAFWKYWKENGETHKHGYYESTWGAINRAIRLVGVVPHSYGELCLPSERAATGPLPTPRTEAIFHEYSANDYNDATGEHYWITFARTLERDLAALQARLDEAERDLVYRQEKIAEQHGQLAEARAKERERCAKVAFDFGFGDASYTIGSAIRALTDEAKP